MADFWIWRGVEEIKEVLVCQLGLSGFVPFISDADCVGGWHWCPRVVRYSIDKETNKFVNNLHENKGKALIVQASASSCYDGVIVHQSS